MSEPAKVKVPLPGVCDWRGKCEGHKPTDEPHECPYQADVNDDHTPVCHCCEQCQRDCADDI